MKSLSVAVAFIVMLGMSGAAHAQSANFVFWSSNGGGCVPMSFAIQGNNYTTGAGAVTSNSTSSEFYCPIQNLAYSSAYLPNTLEMISKGSNVGVPAALITANLISMDRTTGAETVIATATGSSSSSVPVANSVTFSHSFDFYNNYYYIRIYMRGNGTNLKTLYGVRLMSTTIIP